MVDETRTGLKGRVKAAAPTVPLKAQPATGRKPWRRVVRRELLGGIGRRTGTRLTLECGHALRVDFRRDGGSTGLEDRDRVRCADCAELQGVLEPG